MIAQLNKCKNQVAMTNKIKQGKLHRKTLSEKGWQFLTFCFNLFNMCTPSV